MSDCSLSLLLYCVYVAFVKMDMGEGQFSLRAFSNRRFLRVVPPAPSADDQEVWSLEVKVNESTMSDMVCCRSVYADWYTSALVWSLFFSVIIG